MSDKTKKGILLAISSLMQGGMERNKIALYIRDTYFLAPDSISELITVADHRLHLHRA